MDYLALALSEQWMTERRAEAARYALTKQARENRPRTTRRFQVKGPLPLLRLLHLAARPARAEGAP